MSKSPRARKSARTGEAPDQDLYMLEAKRWKLLTREQEKTLALKCVWDPSKGGEVPEEVRKCREEFFSRNMRLVISISNKYRSNSGTTQADLIQEGSIGLMRAIEKFDPTRGIKFSTYAVWWIRQAITRAVHQCHAGDIHIPANLVSNKYQLSRILSSPGYQENKPTAEQLAGDTGWEADYIEKLLGIPVCSADSEADMMVVASPEDNHVMDSNMEVMLMSERIDNLFIRKSIPDRDCAIFWDWVANDCTLSEIGEKHGITRERVRQIVLNLISLVRTNYIRAPHHSSDS